MRLIIEEYKSTVDRTMHFICKAQSWVSVICAVGIWIFSERISLRHGRVAIILTLLSIPSLAWWGKRKIRRFEDHDWRAKHPNLDFSGMWDSHSEFIAEIKVAAIERPPIKNEGCINISQTPFNLKLDSCSLKPIGTQVELGGFDWLAASISEDGQYMYTVYEMFELHDKDLQGKRSHGIGFQKGKVIDWENKDPKKRPTSIVSYWYDCVREDQIKPLYIGKTTYLRRSKD